MHLSVAVYVLSIQEQLMNITIPEDHKARIWCLIKEVTGVSKMSLSYSGIVICHLMASFNKYNQEITSPYRVRQYWTFRDAIFKLHNRFVYQAMA